MVDLKGKSKKKSFNNLYRVFIVMDSAMLEVKDKQILKLISADIS